MDYKKQAEELVNRFYAKLRSTGNVLYYSEAKQCALISERRTLDVLEEIDYGGSGDCQYDVAVKISRTKKIIKAIEEL